MPSGTEFSALVNGFPAVYATALSDWSKFKAAVDAGTVPLSTQREVLTWFFQFPRLWQGIAPNWREEINGHRPTAADIAFSEQVDRFVIRLRGEPLMQEAKGLGLAFIIIAGVAIAAAFGIAGVAWGIGYVKEQANVTRLIEGVTAGKISSAVLADYYKQEKTSVLGGVLGSGLAALAPVLLIAALVWQAPKVFGKASR